MQWQKYQPRPIADIGDDRERHFIRISCWGIFCQNRRKLANSRTVPLAATDERIGVPAPPAGFIIHDHYADGYAQFQRDMDAWVAAGKVKVSRRLGVDWRMRRQHLSARSRGAISVRWWCASRTDHLRTAASFLVFIRKAWQFLPGFCFFQLSWRAFPASCNYFKALFPSILKIILPGNIKCRVATR